MFRTVLRANEETDVEATITGLCTQCDDAGLAAHTTEAIADQARAVLQELVERGRQLTVVGSQMHVTRDLAGDGYLIRLIFRAGDRRTIMQRLMDTLRGR